MWFLIMNYVNHNKVKFKSKILKSIFLYFFLYVGFSCVYIKMPKTLSAKYYQVNKKRLQKKACQRYQNLSKEEKRKVVILSWTWQSFQRMKSKSLLTIEEKCYRMRKKHLILKSDDLKSSIEAINLL